MNPEIDPSCSIPAACEECWERILRLPLECLLADQLYQEAERLVRNCSASFGPDAIAWLKWQLEDGQSFVVEQLELDPDDGEWQRINMALAGARAGIVGDP